MTFFEVLISSRRSALFFFLWSGLQFSSVWKQPSPLLVDDWVVPIWMGLCMFLHISVLRTLRSIFRTKVVGSCVIFLDIANCPRSILSAQNVYFASSKLHTSLSFQIILTYRCFWMFTYHPWMTGLFFFYSPPTYHVSPSFSALPNLLHCLYHD